MVKKTKEVEQVRLKEPPITVMEIRLEGITTYIPHQAGEKVKTSIIVRQGTDKVKRKEPRDLDAECEDCFYRNAKGELYIPGAAFARSLLSVVADFDGVSGAEVKRNIRILSDECLLKHGKIEPRIDRVILAGIGRVMDVRKRPYIHNWSTAVTIQFNANKFSATDILTLFQAAGTCVGVGDWRPEKGGNHGMWKVAKGASR
jgi:hypothetical protein